MKFIELKATYGEVERIFEFSEGTTLIYSKENSVGKSTLLRMLFYSLGYNIPNTQKVRFEKIKTVLKVVIDGRSFLVKRFDKQLEVNYKKEKREFVLPEEQDELLEFLFANSDLNVLENILGAIYFDQDKGWTLLNRGVVIGNIKFNIERLVAGLANIDITEEQEELGVYKKQLAKYRSLSEINVYQKKFLQADTVSNLLEVEKINDRIAVLSSRKKIIDVKIIELNHTAQGNEALVSQLESLRLKVKVPDSDETIPVNKETIDGYDDNVEFIKMRKWSLKEERAKAENDIKRLQQKKLEFQGQLDLLGDKEGLEKADLQLETIRIDTAVVSAKIEELTSKIESLNEQILKKLSSRSAIVDEMSLQILSYAKRLNVAQYLSSRSNFLFLHRLEDLSGTVLHKLVLSFKLAYIKALENKLNVSLPVVLDSPSGREVTIDNISEMMEILEQDFPENQKIIASIYDDRIRVDSKIELNGKSKLFM
ncbi:AAA family ATPase [Lactovum odontotermitis]